LYLDSSALIKLLIREVESERAIVLWSSAGFVASTRLTYVEARSALARALRARRLRPAGLVAAKRRLDTLIGELRLVDARPTLIRAAGELAERYRLRAYDAIHLASALSLERGDLVLASWDAELRRAAREAGLAVAP